MPPPRHSVPSYDGIHPPAGPDPSDTGFIWELIQETNRFAGHRFLPGDWVDLGLTCPGFTIPPTRLYSINSPKLRTKIGGDGKEIDNHSKQAHLGCTVILHPDKGSSTIQPPGKTLQVGGLVKYDHSPCIFALAQNDVSDEFTLFNEETGHIALTVDLREMRNGLQQGIFLRKSLRFAKGTTTDFLQGAWDAYQYSPVYEGVIYEDKVASPQQHINLSALINEFAHSSLADWRPGTNMCVRDLVDPSLYPYAYDVSRISHQGRILLHRIKKFNDETVSDKGLDRWGRKFVTSRYQWLPTTLVITKTGRVKMEGYVNNICRVTYPDLYDALSSLLELFIPRFELVYSYLQELRYVEQVEGMEADVVGIEQVYRPDLKGAVLRGSKLCVITKITDYFVRNDSLQDSFHVEGVSSEHIIMTGLYVLERDEALCGGDLEFRRHFLDFEKSAFYEFLVEARHWRADQILKNGIRPLGSLPTPKGRLIVFPNSHIHRFSEMVNKQLEMTGAEGRSSLIRIVSFLVVDPEREVITTSEVPQQQGTTMNYHHAKVHRFDLLTERKQFQAHLNNI